MRPKLSILIACYNSSETLEEAVNSVFTQELTDPFEIVMVDDASTDNTKSLMKDLALKHPEVKLFFHDKNMGGGATRNTAAANASGELMFCLDSDDILGKGTLNKMVKFLEEKGADAVGISTSIKFRDRDVNNVAFTNHFGFVGEKVPFESLFEPEKAICPLYSTFLHTKKSYEIAGGYPTDHGFDTQGFAFRFLANGLVAYTCPDAVYLHRIDFHKSYYLREYEAGKINHNWFRVYREFLYLFNPETAQEILDFDLNDPAHFLNQYVSRKPQKLKEDYKTFLIPHSQEEYLKKVDDERNVYDNYWAGSYYFRKSHYQKAASHFFKTIEGGLLNPHPLYKLIDSLSRLNHSDYQSEMKRVESLLDYQPQGSQLPFYRRLLNKIRRTLHQND